MYEYDKVVLDTFLEQQTKLYKEKVAETPEEARDFLEMSMAAVCRDKKELKSYFKELGADTSWIKDGKLDKIDEVFSLPDGRYLVVDL